MDRARGRVVAGGRAPRCLPAAARRAAPEQGHPLRRTAPGSQRVLPGVAPGVLLVPGPQYVPKVRACAPQIFLGRLTGAHVRWTFAVEAWTLLTQVDLYEIGDVCDVG